MNNFYLWNCISAVRSRSLFNINNIYLRLIPYTYQIAYPVVGQDLYSYLSETKYQCICGRFTLKFISGFSTKIHTTLMPYFLTFWWKTQNCTIFTRLHELCLRCPISWDNLQKSFSHYITAFCVNVDWSDLNTQIWIFVFFKRNS